MRVRPIRQSTKSQPHSLRLCAPKPSLPSMPLFGWMKRPRGDGEREQGVAREPGGPSRTLMRELLWHVEERERLAREVEREHHLSHGTLGYGWMRSYPSLRSLIPPSERQQLEYLCAQIPPVHTAAVLCRDGYFALEGQHVSNSSTPARQKSLNEN
ncbi:hypothetical protein SKAU_G00335790 [Synaphobranchus kaupii]|uniref:Uncharacterized protein n=1 Tax=Synaphobranchus kaupii TaxID=118154 RepID=A0A9Q1EM19_SYNKA|nr:hypothetical protein SKAU_G00335790 [Synaphobranchus kaupii]